MDVDVSHSELEDSGKLIISGPPLTILVFFH